MPERGDERRQDSWPELNSVGNAEKLGVSESLKHYWCCEQQDNKDLGKEVFDTSFVMPWKCSPLWIFLFKARVRFSLLFIIFLDSNLFYFFLM